MGWIQPCRTRRSGAARTVMVLARSPGSGRARCPRWAYLIPAAVQTAAPTALHRSDTATALSVITVASMFAALTQTGVRRTAGSVVAAFVGSVVEPLSRPDGGVWPARR